ncbi:MAG: type II toxin-antitoxin system YafQ family toxin [Chitinispirillia bacterium]|nr:type II toxin-antitoxin system YafQ family toxin [Chitinispirillia bacterium]MCL2269140.1 type II toxin-antitoxin system YafQ family toxin [Chitinispirillia bacterium]
MLRLETTKQYRKDRKRVKKQGKDMTSLDIVIKKLQNREPLDPKYCDHQLTGNFARLRECHITPDWLLIYAIDNGRLVLTASRTGSHSELF